MNVFCNLSAFVSLFSGIAYFFWGKECHLPLALFFPPWFQLKQYVDCEIKEYQDLIGKYILPFLAERVGVET